LFVVPVDRAGGAERVLAIAARELARSPGWNVEIAVLAGRTAPFIAENVGSAAIRYGRWGGHFGTEWLLLGRLARRRYDLVYSSHTRINAFLSLMRRLGVLRCERLVARESTVLSDRSSGVRLAAYRMLYRLYGRHDLIIAQTGYMADRLRTMLPTAARHCVEVVSNPVDVEAIRQAAAMRPDEPLHRDIAIRKRDRCLIAWCGRLIGIKRPLLALEVLHE
jgi:hypothetical protein